MLYISSSTASAATVSTEKTIYYGSVWPDQELITLEDNECRIVNLKSSSKNLVVKVIFTISGKEASTGSQALIYMLPKKKGTY